MIRVCQLIFIALFFTGTTHATTEDSNLPNVVIQVLEGDKNSYYSRVLAQNLQKQLKKEFDLRDKGAYQYKVVLTLGETRKIEGMMSITVVEVAFQQIVKDPVSNAVIWESETTAEGKGNNEKAAVLDALDKFATKPARSEMLNEQVEAHLQVAFNEDCHQTLQSIVEDGNWKEMMNALVLLEYFPEDGACAAAVEEKRDRINANLNDFLCTHVIHKMKLKVESRRYNRDKVLDQLLLIPPDAECAGEALEVAKLIGEQLSRYGNTSQQNEVNTYISVHSGNDPRQYRNLRARRYY